MNVLEVFNKMNVQCPICLKKLSPWYMVSETEALFRCRWHCLLVFNKEGVFTDYDVCSEAWLGKVSLLADLLPVLSKR